MFEITVITPTLGRRSILKLIESLQRQDVKILHLIMWDSKRVEDGLSPEDPIFKEYHSENYISYHYVIQHPVYHIKRIDNFLRYNGIIMTTTDFITQIDDDCWLEENWFKRGIEDIKKNEWEYTFCQRFLWKNEEEKMGLDTYESIGEKNQFGYHLMETNSILFSKTIALHIANITYQHNMYGHDRILAEYLITHHKGGESEMIGLNQIVPDFLIGFHEHYISHSSIVENEYKEKDI